VAATPAHIEFATPPPDAFDLVDADHDDDEPVRFRKLADVGVTGTPPGLADREMEGGAVDVHQCGGASHIQRSRVT
jgi:hypothetical protein